MKILLLLLMVISFGCSTINIEGPKPKEVVFKPIWIKNHDPQYSTGNLPIGLQSPLIHKGILYAGHNQGFMKAYDLSNGRLIWETKDGGAYHNAPILLEDNIIYGTVSGRVYCRNRLNGKLVYNVDLGAAIESDGVLSRGRLYFHTRNHKLFSLDALTGKVLWAYKRSIPFLTTLQRVSKPLVYQNKVFVGFADGTIAAFSQEEGILLWEKKIVNGQKFIDVDMSPTVWNSKLILGSLSGPLSVIDPTTGSILRRIDLHASRQPLILTDFLVIGSVDGEVVLFDKNLKEVKRNKISQFGISSIVSWKEGLAASSVGGELFYLDAKNLNVLSKMKFGHSSSAIFGSLIQEEGKLAAFTSRNRLYVFE